MCHAFRLGFVVVDPRVVDPATDNELGTVPEMGLAETREAIEAAGRAFKTWSRTTAKVSVVPWSHRSSLRATAIGEA